MNDGRRRKRQGRLYLTQPLRVVDASPPGWGGRESRVWPTSGGNACHRVWVKGPWGGHAVPNLPPKALHRGTELLHPCRHTPACAPTPTPLHPPLTHAPYRMPMIMPMTTMHSSAHRMPLLIFWKKVLREGRAGGERGSVTVAGGIDGCE